MEKAIRHLPARCLLLALGFAAATSPAGAQSYPSGMIRIVSATAAGTPPDIVAASSQTSSPKARAGASSSRTSPAQSRLLEPPRLSSSRRTATPSSRSRLPSSAAPALLPNVGFSVGCRFRPGHQARQRLPRAGGQPVRSGELAARAGRPAETRARQADLLVRRLRHAGPSRRRDVQVADRRARDPRALPGASARHRRSAQWNEPLPVHLAAARWSIWSPPASCARLR